MVKTNHADESVVLGVDLGGTKVLSAVITESGQIISRAKKKTKPQKTPKEILNRVVDCCRETIEKSDFSVDSIRAIGIGSPGPLDPEKGIIIETPNINLTNAPVAPFIQSKLDIPVFLDNDVNVGTLGEFVYGAGKGKKDIIGLFLGTGLGGGVIVNGSLLHGHSFNAGELGHMKIRAGGAVCGCGQKGCLEAYASKTALIKRFQNAVYKGKKTILTDLIGDDWSRLTSSTFVKAVEAKDGLVLFELKRAAKYTGIAVGSLLNILSPEMVVLGGGLVEALEDYILPTVREYAKYNCFPICYEGVEIVSAALGDDAGILGAAALAWQNLDKKKKKSDD